MAPEIFSWNDFNSVSHMLSSKEKKGSVVGRIDAFVRCVRSHESDRPTVNKI